MKFRCIWIILILMLLFGCTQAPTTSPQVPSQPEPAAPEPAPPVETAPEPAPVEPPVVGGDRDEHGCIGSAGYSWCELKQRCLRQWEENCTEDKILDAPAAPAHVYSTAKCDYLTDSEISSTLGYTFSLVPEATPLEPAGCSKTYFTSDVKSNFIMQMWDYSERDKKLAVTTLTDNECKSIPGYPMTVSIGSEVGEKSCRRDMTAQNSRQFLFAKNGILVKLGYTAGEISYDKLIKLAKIIEGRISSVKTTPVAAPVSGPSGRSTDLLEEGVAGKPTGTAGWASNLAIREVLKRNKGLKLYAVSSESPDTDMPQINRDGKIIEGSYWRFTYMTDDRKVQYAAYVYKGGKVDVKEEDIGSAIYPIKNWKLDSDELLLKGHALKPDFKMGYIGIMVGGKGPIAQLKLTMIDMSKVLGLSAETGEKIIETGF